MTENLLDKVCSLVDSSKDVLIGRLLEAVAISNAYDDPTKRSDVAKMVEWTKTHLERLGVACKVWPLSSDVSVPPALLGTFGSDPAKKTLLIYIHFDGQPAKKGFVVAWINAIETMQKVGLPIPVNIKFVFEGMEESGSLGLTFLVNSRRDFLKGIDYVFISDIDWLRNNKPSIKYGLRGVCYFHVQVSGPPTDLHSGLQGGVVKEPLNDLVWLMSQLTTGDGKPNIPKLAEMIQSADEKEKNTLSIHGIEGAFSDPGGKTVIPAKVTGKLSIRIVSDVKPEQVAKAVVEYLGSLYKLRGAPNQLKTTMVLSSKAWMTDPKSANYRAAHNAIAKVFGVEPDYTREGGPNPIVATLQDVTGVPVLLLPICASADNFDPQNEKMSFADGIKLIVNYLDQLGKI